MNRFLVFVSLICLILAGCSDDEVAKNKLPNTPSYSPYSEDYKKPLDLQVRGVKDGVAGILVDFCWEADGKTCNMESRTPQEVLEEEESGGKSLVVSKGEVLVLELSADGSYIPEYVAFNPDEKEIKQYSLLDNAFEIVESKDLHDSPNDFQITTPMAEGRYFYSLTLKYTGDVKGEAYYVFSVFVK